MSEKMSVATWLPRETVAVLDGIGQAEQRPRGNVVRKLITEALAQRARAQLAKRTAAAALHDELETTEPA